MSNPESIRKAAILVSLLDTRSADALLDSMGPQLADHVRQAVMDLDEVTPEEEDEVLSAFFGRDAAAAGGVELDLSAGESNSHEPSYAAAPFAPRSDGEEQSLHFLSDIDPALLADVLAREHPQTVAVVVSHLPPERAGQVLERLSSALATEALSRMAWLGEPVPGVLADLARELRRRLEPYLQTAGRSPAGVWNVQAILASLPVEQRTQLIERLARRDERLHSRLSESLAHAFRGDDAHRQVISLRYRLETSDARQSAEEASRQTVTTPLVEFEDLALLSQRDLTRLAAAADDRLLALALIEADERLARRLLSSLPGERAADVRQRMAQPGPIRLKEIDQAQRRLAELAGRLARSGHISLPPSRPFAAAV